MNFIYRFFIGLILVFPLAAKANSGFVKLLLGVEPKQVLEGKDKSAVVLTQGYLGYKAFNYIQQTDSLGNIQWLVNLFPIQDTSVQFGVDMVDDNNGNILVITNHKNGNNGLLQKVTKIKDGVILYTRVLGNADSLQPLPLRTYAVTDDSSILHILHNTSTNRFYLQEINSQADIVWTKAVDASNFNAGLDTVSLFGLEYEMHIRKIDNQKYSITGVGLNTGANKYELFQAVFDISSQSFQYNHFQLPEVVVNPASKPILFSEGILNSSTIRIALMNYNTTIPLNSYYISDLDIANGTKHLAYTFTDSSNNAHFPQRLYIDNTGNLFFLKPNSLFKKDMNGNLVWNRIMFPDRIISADVVEEDFVFMQNLTELSDSTFYIIGRGGKGFPGNFCLCFGVLIKANKNGVIYERLIDGKVFVDENKNCSDESEPGLKQVLIEASNSSSAFYSVTDSLGNYSIPVDIGSYTVKAYLNNTTYWQSCTPSVQVNTLTDTTHASFAIQKQIECPYLDVDIATPFLRRCFNNTYNVHYCNYGTSEATDAYIKIVFDPLLQVQSSSLPWTTVNGNTYTFFLGNIPEQQCGDFNITAYLDCDSTVLGQTHCVQAFIYPDSICVPTDPLWDGAVISVSGKCTGDSVHLEVQNSGAGDMLKPKKYYVLEGDFLRTAPQDFQLTAGASTSVTVPVNGKTITLLAQQTDNFPYPGNPIISVEGCNGTLDPGYVNHFPQNNPSPFIAVNCTQNIGSYDPNFKAPLPVGVDSLHFITNNTPLEYIIHFQNTGTDTAFSIIVTDTISKNLNVTTLRPGASSHPYSFQVENSGILKVYFNNIRLPDSSENTDASQGYFKFSIRPKSTLVDYSRINNNATIYFDFNKGVSTNPVFHTVKENLFNVLTTVAEPYRNVIMIHAYPNPFSDQLTINLSGKEMPGGVYRFNLFDVHGKLLFSDSFTRTLSLDARKFAESLYLYTITRENTTVATGKLIKQ